VYVLLTGEEKIPFKTGEDKRENVKLLSDPSGSLKSSNVRALASPAVVSRDLEGYANEIPLSRRATGGEYILYCNPFMKIFIA